MTKVTIDRLGEAIKETLDEYKDEVDRANIGAVEQTAKWGAQAIQSSARSMFKTKHNYKYAKGWRYEVTGTRTYARATIYNSSVPGLPHLLEYGHELYLQGGRTTGKAHIKPVEETIEECYTRNIEVMLT